MEYKVTELNLAQAVETIAENGKALGHCQARCALLERENETLIAAVRGQTERAESAEANAKALEARESFQFARGYIKAHYDLNKRSIYVPPWIFEDYERGISASNRLIISDQERNEVDKDGSLGFFDARVYSALR